MVTLGKVKTKEILNKLSIMNRMWDIFAIFIFTESSSYGLFPILIRRFLLTHHWRIRYLM